MFFVQKLLGNLLKVILIILAKPLAQILRSGSTARRPGVDAAPPRLCASKTQSLTVRSGTESQITEAQNQKFCASFSALKSE